MSHQPWEEVRRGRFKDQDRKVSLMWFFVLRAQQASLTFCFYSSPHCGCWLFRCRRRPHCSPPSGQVLLSQSVPAGCCAPLQQGSPIRDIRRPKSVSIHLLSAFVPAQCRSFDSNHAEMHQTQSKYTQCVVFWNIKQHCVTCEKVIKRN